MTELKHTFTSTGAKFFAHQEAMRNLQNGKGQPIVTHVMATDICNHKCAFCSVGHREGDTLPLSTICGYLDILLKYKLKATILSGGGNPILYKCPKTGHDFNRLVDEIHGRGLELGLITNGMPLKRYEDGRVSWKTVHPDTLDKFTWIRISMSGLDHPENQVFIPDINPEKTTIGFSYVLYDEYPEPADHFHGKVSTPADLITIGDARNELPPTRWAVDRLPDLTDQIGYYVKAHHPSYVRTLPNCLEPSLIPERCKLLNEMADTINDSLGVDDYRPVFCQYKPPSPPNVCLLGIVHPVLGPDGNVRPCDSCCLNESADHKFGDPWVICRWDKIGDIYERPAQSLIKDPKTLCPGCVFGDSNRLLEQIWIGELAVTPLAHPVLHENFV